MAIALMNFMGCSIMEMVSYSTKVVFRSTYTGRHAGMSVYKSDSERLETNIAPWLSVNDASSAVDYFKAAFDAVELYRLEDDKGKLAIAQLSIKGANF